MGDIQYNIKAQLIECSEPAAASAQTDLNASKINRNRTTVPGRNMHRPKQHSGCLSPLPGEATCKKAKSAAEPPPHLAQYPALSQHDRF